MNKITKIVFGVLVSLEMLLATQSVTELSSDTFEKTLKNNKSVVVKFSASWCGACQAMKPFYDEVAQELKSNTFFAMVDTDKEQKLSEIYHIDALPTTILFKEGKEVSREVGGLDKEEIELFVSPELVLGRYSKSCQNKNAEDCHSLGDYYSEAGKDMKKAMDFYEKACTLGNTKSCFRMAYKYDLGEGVKEDNVKAQQYYEQACEQNYGVSCHNLAIMYEKGETKKKDNQQVLKLYAKACKLEYSDACYNLALVYEKGKIIKKDLSQAKHYYELGCNLGDKDACKALK